MARVTSAPTLGIEQAAAPVATQRRTIAALVETTKPGITRLVTITSMVGFAAAAMGRRWDWSDLALTAGAAMVGTAFSAAGANSINQWMERTRDAKMKRTAQRPLPTGRVTPTAVLTLGITLGGLGFAVLAAFNGLVPACIALTCLLVYVLWYTPMKVHSTLSTFVGAIPGALPPLIGWSAGSEDGWASLGSPGGWSLFFLMFVWQIPHFLAIAWMYRDDYAAGGYRVLTTVEDGDRKTAEMISVWTLLLLPATLAPAWLLPVKLGAPYLIIATLAGAAFTWLAFRLVKARTRADARKVFFASIMHLPLILAALVVESAVRVWMR